MTNLYLNFSTSPVQNKLASGMRIAGKTASEMPQETGRAAAEESAPPQNTIHQRFAAEMTARLEAVNPDDPQAAASLAESLNTTAEEIKTKFGQDKANEFMSQVLRATDSQINAVKLTTSVSNFFSQLARDQKDPGAQENLKSIRESLNKGLAASVDGEKTDADQETGLAVSINRFFGTKPNLTEDRSGLMVQGFNSSLRWAGIKVGGEQQELDPATWNRVYTNLGGLNTEEHITVADETVREVASFLRNVVGNEDAAANVENGASTDFLGAVATSMAIVAQENGQAAAFGFQSFLNDNVAGDMVTDSGDSHLKRWGLTRDYANPDAELPIPPPEPKDLFIMSGDDTDALQDKKHQGLTINWEDRNGVTSGSTVDLNELYAQYKSVKSAADTGNGAGLNNAVGNLVDTTT